MFFKSFVYLLNVPLYFVFLDTMWVIDSFPVDFKIQNWLSGLSHSVINLFLLTHTSIFLFFFFIKAKYFSSYVN